MNLSGLSMAGNSAKAASASDVLEKITAAGIETVRVVFPDQHGILRGKTLVARAMQSAFDKGVGMPSTLLLKDTSHRTVFPIWSGDTAPDFDGLPLAGASDILATPDPATFRRLPHAPHSAVILCDVTDRDGTAISLSSREVLRRAEAQLTQAGFAAMFGLEVEFQVFQIDDPALSHAQATMPPAPVRTKNTTQGYQFLTETRYGEAEDLLDDIRRMAEEMRLAPRTVEIEMGPSQFEFTFDPSGPMEQADRYILFRTMVKELCQTRGLHASFMAKPRLENAAANGWHIHQSLTDLASGTNAFTPDTPGALTPVADGWIAGLLANAAASCVMTTPTINGYKRYAPHQLAPNRIQWGTDNRGAMIRALLFPGDGASRVENRVADSSANPYFALAAQMLSGLDGLNRSLKAPAPTSDPYDTGAKALPRSLIEAVDAFESSAFYRSALGDDFVDYLAHIKRAEWERYVMTVSEWEQAEYFNLF
nr:glutamine synthetase family protein [Aestuariivita boseongensis]